MKFTLKDIGALGFWFQMHQRETSTLRLLTKCLFCFILLLVDIFRVRVLN